MNYKNLTKKEKELKKNRLLKLVTFDFQTTNDITRKSKEKDIFDNWRSVKLNLDKLKEEGKIINIEVPKSKRKEYLWKKEIDLE